ncbi:hypothetical protein AGOR_G00148750 [Albula goreensis]|uniref:Ig-like domain-containing protein n=1 Tax=Albula goreensis TaxID=1534307 RepID=A0A8T3D8I3_9TELE|nr:hypothetical protein AGOR_G00148750 [Albula goreensis]
MNVRKTALLWLSIVILITVSRQEAEVKISPAGNEFKVNQGSSLKFTCEYIGSECTEIKYNWKKQSDRDNDGIKIEGRNLTFSRVTLEHDGTYVCQVTCEGNKKVSKITKIRVYAFGEPVLRMPPNVEESHFFNATCIVEDLREVQNTHVKFAWYLGDQLLNEYSVEVKDDPAKAWHTLPLGLKRTDHGKILICAVKLIEHNETKKVSHTVTVNYAPTVNAEVKSPLIEGDQIVMSCMSDGRPKPSIQWERLGHPWPSSLSRNPNGTVTGVLHRHDRGQYECLASNQVAVVRHNVSLEVQYGPKNTSIMALPQRLIHRGELLNLTCLTDIYPEAHHYTWRKIPTMIMPLGVTMADSSLIIESFQEAHEGVYECEVVHHSGKTERAYFSAELKAEAEEAVPTQMIGAFIGSVLFSIIGGILIGFLVGKRRRQNRLDLSHQI